ncbi:MAG: NfeD family protein [Gammaproteobacteria bacterium]|nr:NfeD family protein [Gammaproteobacteria bacterium]
MEAFFNEYMNHWTWLSLGVLFIIIELVAPGAMVMWLGIAAIAMGLIVSIVPVSWEWQIFLFSLFSVGSVLFWRARLRKHPQQSDNPALNKKGNQLVGTHHRLSEAIVDGKGKININDSLWIASGPDLPKGAKVEVREVDGNRLEVIEIED